MLRRDVYLNWHSPSNGIHRRIWRIESNHSKVSSTDFSCSCTQWVLKYKQRWRWNVLLQLQLENIQSLHLYPYPTANHYHYQYQYHHRHLHQTKSWLNRHLVLLFFVPIVVPVFLVLCFLFSLITFVPFHLLLCFFDLFCVMQEIVIEYRPHSCLRCHHCY